MKYTLETAIAGLQESPFKHYLTATFIFADDRPNDNKQAIPFDEFDNVARSAIGMPVKILFKKDFLGNASADDHPGAYPIGHIQEMSTKELEDGSHQLIATAALWSQEYPEIIQWIQDQYEAGKAPGLSWELRYKEGIIDKGIEWLKGVITTAATFVKFPAYGTRTALLSLASIQNPEEHGDEIAQVLLAIAAQLQPPTPEPKDKGGNQMTEEEKARYEAALKEATELKDAAAAKQTEYDALKTANDSLTTENQSLKDEVSTLKRNALVDSRVKKYTELVGAMPEVEAEASKLTDFLVNFDDDQFNYHIDQLVAIKKSATPAAPTTPAAASLKMPTALPRLELPKTDDNLATARASFKALARPNSAE